MRFWFDMDVERSQFSKYLLKYCGEMLAMSRTVKTSAQKKGRSNGGTPVDGAP